MPPQPLTTIATIVRILIARYLRMPRRPGFLLHSKSGRYALHYHAEQAPNQRSSIALSNKLDRYGVPFLDVQLRFSTQDAQSVLRAHEILDEALRAARYGRLEYHEPDPVKRLDHILERASDGFHQIGTTRMNCAPAMGVVDSNCRVHGFDNLYLAAGSVLPTSGQASPTFVAVAFALRLADHLGELHSTTS